MSGTKRDADTAAAAGDEKPSQQTQQQDHHHQQDSKNDARTDKAQGPDIKRVKLDEGLGQPSSPTSEPVDVAPSSPTNALLKSKNERNQSGHRGGGRGGGGGGRGGRQGDKKKNNNNNKGKQRDWGDNRKSNKDGEDAQTRNDNDAEGDQDGGDGKPRIPKKKVAMLIGYSGLGYSGSQVNPGVKTIESEVFDACIKAGAVSEDNSDNVNKVSLMRAARTDAGVSAAINVLNLKLILEPPSKPADMSIEDHINSFLPPTIRVWQVIRVQGGFHARTMCDSRMYNYSLPTYCFLEPRPDTAMGKRIQRKEGEKSWWESASKTEMLDQSKTDGETAKEAAESTAADEPAKKSFKEDQILRKAYRIPPELLERVRQLFQAFHGSHNFWNFTVGKEFSDRSCQRVMKNLTLTEPFMVNDQEWISLKFHGQSFMLHQIRKMVALIILCARTGTPPSLIPETFGPARLNIPKAPALGLLLEQPHFHSYNRKVLESNARIEARLKKAGSGKGGSKAGSTDTPSKEADEANQLRDPIDYAAVEDKVEQFKRDVILKTMYDEEDKEDTFALWLNLHDGQTGPEFDYLNVKGVIPQSAIFGKSKLAQNNQTNAPGSPQRSTQTLPDVRKATPFEEPEDEEALLAKLNSGRQAAELDG